MCIGLSMVASNLVPQFITYSWITMTLVHKGTLQWQAQHFQRDYWNTHFKSALLIWTRALVQALRFISLLRCLLEKTNYLCLRGIQVRSEDNLLWSFPNSSKNETETWTAFLSVLPNPWMLSYKPHKLQHFLVFLWCAEEHEMHNL